MRLCRFSMTLAALLALAGCGSQRAQQSLAEDPQQVRAQILRLLPPKVVDRAGWAADIQLAFTRRGLSPSVENLCSVLAVTEQESNFQIDPAVPGMGRIARQEVDRRAARVHVPGVLVSAALRLPSSTGKSYSERLDSARTEKDLSLIFEDFIGQVPLGRTLFDGFNPVHTAGPMQVSIAFAEQQARDYPYTVEGSIRHEVFSRRGGLYFGIVHLLGYPANYPEPLYRFADFNAGWYASRNAAFQSALSQASGVTLALDGDLINYGALLPGTTERAVRQLGQRLGLRNPQIRSQLEQGDSIAFESTELYRKVFALAEKAAGKPLPRAILPGITLQSPKITRTLTTAWFAKRVDERRQRCMARVGG